MLTSPDESAKMSDVLEGRQTSADIPEAELRAALERIASLFKNKWLVADSPSALQSLWRRRDITSTWELFWLGSALRRLGKTKTRWLADQVNILKTGGRNERIGAAFEILALALFAGPDHDVLPGTKNQPGYDGTLLFNDRSVARVSLKNFGRSSHQKQFDADAATTHEEFKATLARNPRKWIGIAAFAETFPNDAAWTALRAAVTTRVTDGSSAGPTSKYVGPWLIRHTASPNEASLHPAYGSYTFQIVTPHHNNESKNVEHSLARAFSNFDRHVPKSINGSSNIMLVRLSDAFFVPRLVDWARAHLERVGTHLDEVFLYQPAIAFNSATSVTSLMHYLAVLKVGDNRHPTVKATLPVGTIATKPTRPILIAGATEMSLQDHHLFQAGEIYHAGELKLGEESPLKLDFGPGIIAHNVLRIMGGNDTMLLSPRHPPNWRLSLLND